MKRLIALLMALTMIFTLSCPAYAATSEMVKKAMELETDLGTINDTDYVMPLSEKQIMIERERLAMQYFSARNTAKSGYAAVNVTRFPQITGYYCGPASAQIVINSFGISIPSATRTLCFFNLSELNGICPYQGVPHTCVASYTSPQITLADEMGTTCGGTTFSNLKNAINERVRGLYAYGLSAATTTAQLRSYIYSALSEGAPCIAYVTASNLPNYPSGFSGHYVVIYKIDNSDTVRICDCNYYVEARNTPEPTYPVSLSDLLNALKPGYNIMW